MANLSGQALQDVRVQLNAAVAAAAAEPPAAMVTAAAAAAAAPDFCGIYKTAKPILTTAVTILPFILPGLGATVATAIKALMAIGDQACPSS